MGDVGDWLQTENECKQYLVTQQLKVIKQGETTRLLFSRCENKLLRLTVNGSIKTPVTKQEIYRIT